MSEQPNENEIIKINSRLLRGSLKQSMADDATGALAPDDAQISKFHGFYEQDDRDVRQDRRDHFLEPDYSFMLRARLPGGVCTPKQWLAIDEIGRTLGNGSIRLTTRQTFQFHGILKHNMKPLIQSIHKVMIDSIGGCGDVNRNVLCNPNPEQSILHREVYAWTKKISEHLLPKTRAYHEIWLDGEVLEGTESEPLYGETYLPRKFKVAIAIPPHNDVDVYTNDLGFIAIGDETLKGFNVLAGGGMGVTHGDQSTFPRLADELGFIRPEQVLAVSEAVVSTQRDFGNRVSRRHARLKYTIESMGLKAFRAEVEKRSGVTFSPACPVSFSDQGDRYGWSRGVDECDHLTLYIENGRVDGQVLLGLRKLAEQHVGDFRITPNQNLIIASVPRSERAQIESIVEKYGLSATSRSPLRLSGLACVAFPTCPQAMSESERVFPAMLTKLESIMTKHAIQESCIVFRVTGCPNGCARPYVAEVALVGKGIGRYNLLLGGDGKGARLSAIYQENVKEDVIFRILDSLFGRYALERLSEEGFGDFVVRIGLVPEIRNPAEDYYVAIN